MKTHEESIALARKDVERRDYTVQSCTKEDAGYAVNFTDGTCLLVRDVFAAAEAPKAGSVLRCFGRGFGYVVRGIGLIDRRFAGEKRLVALYRYETAEEEKENHARSVADKTQKSIEEWETKKGETAAAIAALPDVFRQRFEFFMRTPGWGPEFGPYEIFVMQEAVKMATRLGSADAIAEFVKKSAEEQKRIIPDLGEGHSGNTFGMACRLAHLYLKEPALVPKMHGALCALVGCETYGCWSQTAEAAASRRRHVL